MEPNANLALKIVLPVMVDYSMIVRPVFLHTNLLKVDAIQLVHQINTVEMTIIAILAIIHAKLVPDQVLKIVVYAQLIKYRSEEDVIQSVLHINTVE